MLGPFRLPFGDRAALVSFTRPFSLHTGREQHTGPRTTEKPVISAEATSASARSGWYRKAMAQEARPSLPEPLRTNQLSKTKVEGLTFIRR